MDVFSWVIHSSSVYRTYVALSFHTKEANCHSKLASVIFIPRLVAGSSCSKGKYCLPHKAGRHDYKRKYRIERTAANRAENNLGENRRL